MSSAVHLRKFVHNEGLFTASYFDRVLADGRVPVKRVLPDDAVVRLQRLREIWQATRNSVLQPNTLGKKGAWAGLPGGWYPLPNSSESNLENGFVRPILESVLTYKVDQNRTLRTRPVGAKGERASLRPDLIAFADEGAYNVTVQRTGDAGREGVKGAPDGVEFCRSAAFIIDVKAFGKGVGADEIDITTTSKSSDKTAAQDVDQVAGYLDGYDRKWGVLTNGRSWRLMVQGGGLDRHLRFDLVLFLEQLPPTPTTDDLEVFNLFWHLFGRPAVAGGWLDKVASEAEANTRKVREVLRQQAHAAVEQIANGFWHSPNNASHGLVVSPQLPTQAQIDRLREVSLTLLYRLLFVLKAEAQNLLPTVDELGGQTDYARKRSMGALLRKLQQISPEDRARFSDGWEQLRLLFHAIDQGDAAYKIPAYNGGLFDASRHTSLRDWQLTDEALYDILRHLMFQAETEKKRGKNVEPLADPFQSQVPVPYGDLDVRDLGDIYEGLLEQRLVGESHPVSRLVLRNEKGERKASGSYFTPERLVDYLVRSALNPVLEECGGDRARLLSLRILDPAMGSGHFLVKAVDILADWLTINCDPEDPKAPRDNGPKERAYWKRVVVENCIYGVDSNPMAVELARVALWLHTAEYGKPLSFLDHHLKIGNSLVGIPLNRLSAPGLKSRQTKNGPVWEAVPAPEDPFAFEPASQEISKATIANAKKAKADSGQLSLLFSIDTTLVTGILKSIHSILARPSETAAQMKQKGQEYAKAVEQRLAAHRLLADLWCLQWFSGPPTTEFVHAYESPDGIYQQVKEACGIQLDEKRQARLAELSSHSLVQKTIEARQAGFGPRFEAYFHWQLEFPEVAFTPDGKAHSGFGFDVVIGNPPWDKIKPESKQFYGPWGDATPKSGRDIANAQGASLDRIIRDFHRENPGLEHEWIAYNQTIGEFVRFLNESGIYKHQTMEIDGKKTGGDPDLFRYFVERALQATRNRGRVAQIVPSTLWQGEGCSALRHRLLDETACQEVFVFENYRKWAFHIDSRFKFTTFITQLTEPKPGHSFKAGFMLRDTRALDGRLPERIVRLNRRDIAAMSPGTLALLDLTSDADAKLLGRLHSDFRGLGDPESDWRLKYRAELHMTSDAWRFKARDWMQQRGFRQVLREKQPDGSWLQIVRFGSQTATYNQSLPPGGERWLAADLDWYVTRGYRTVLRDVGGVQIEGVLHPDDALISSRKNKRDEVVGFIVPGGVYVPLYEGRMVHNFDHAAKHYVRGEGRRAEWAEQHEPERTLNPRVFVWQDEVAADPKRVGFCDVTGATNERSMLAALLPSTVRCGHKVPTLNTSSSGKDEILGEACALLNSLVWDYLVRQRVSTSMTWTMVSRVPSPRIVDWDKLRAHLVRVHTWSAELQPVLDGVCGKLLEGLPRAPKPHQLMKLRAELDAAVAHSYKLTVAEYAHILTGFPLLDRAQPPLEGDLFVTDTDREGPGVLTTPWGKYDTQPRSFITRDLALLTYINLRRQKGFKDGVVPSDLHAFYRDQVGIDPDGPLSRFRIGKIRDLADRVHAATELGAVAYVPTGRGGGDDSEDGGEIV
jgi:hypothetical protein